VVRSRLSKTTASSIEQGAAPSSGNEELGSSSAQDLQCVESPTATSSTTKFDNDSCLIQSDVTAPYPVKPPIEHLSDRHTATLPSFLEKPYNIMGGLIATTDSASTGLTAVTTPASGFSTKYFPSALFNLINYSRKLEGIYGWRGDLVFRLVVNAERLQQCMLIMSFFPPTTLLDPTSSMTALTQTRHVKLNINGGRSEAILRVPWAQWHPFYRIWPTTDGTGPNTHDMGALVIAIASTLQTAAGDNNFDWNVFVHCENNELIGTTSGAHFYSQSGRSVAAREMPISSTLTKVATAAGMLKDVPLVGPAAGAASWVAAKAAGVDIVFHSTGDLHSLVFLDNPSVSTLSTADW